MKELNRRQFLTSVAVGVPALYGLGLAAIPAARAARPIRIGASLPYSGFMQADGVEMSLGMYYWREELNRNGGLLGRPVEFVIYNDNSTGDGAAAAYRRLLEHDQVDLVMGTVGTPATAGAIPVLESHGMPCVFPHSWGPLAWDIPRQWCVPSLPIAGAVPHNLVQTLSDLGIRSMAIIRDSSGYSRDLTAGLRHWLREAGIDIRGEVKYPRGEITARREALRKAESYGAECIGCGGAVDEVKPLIQDVTSLGIDARAFAWFDFDDNRLLPLAGAAEGMLGTGIWTADADFPGNAQFVRGFLRRWSIKRPDWSRRRLLQHHAPAGYAPGQVLKAAVEHAASLEPTAVRDALWTLDMPTIYGRFKVDDDGYQIGKEMLVLQYQRRVRRIVGPQNLHKTEARLPTLRRSLKP